MSTQVCSICGEEKCEGQVWFLVAESHWEDKLKILQWEAELANRQGMHSACCPAHVQELVSYWMSSGDVDSLLPTAGASLPRSRTSKLPYLVEPDTRGARELGELAVDRASVGRALNENPDSLLVILDELRDALERETASASASLESATTSRLMRQV